MRGALLALLVGALGAVPCAGFVRKSEWSAGQNDGLGGALVGTCNPGRVAFAETDVSSIKRLTSTLAQRRLWSRVMGTAMEKEWRPLRRRSELVFNGGELFVLDSCMEWDGETGGCRELVGGDGRRIFAITMTGQHDELFSVQFSERGESRCTFDLSEAPPVPHAENDDVLSEECYRFRVFQKPYPEMRRLLTSNSDSPSSLALSPESRYLAWLETTRSGASFVRVYDLEHRFTLPEDDLNSGERMGRDADLVGSLTREQPVFCGEDELLYAGRSGNQSAVFLRHLGTNHVNVETLAQDAFFPVAAAASKRMVAASGGLHTCTGAWVHRDRATITIIQLPRKEMVHVGREAWGGGDATAELIDMAVAGDHLFVVAYSHATAMYRVRVAPVMDLDHFYDVPDTESETTLKFHSSASGPMLLFSKQGAGGADEDELRLLSFDNNDVHCVVESKALREDVDDGSTAAENDSKRILDAAVYRDVVVWLSTSQSTPELALELLDLDKDNDFVLDAIDHFPFNTNCTFDADGDGLSDEMDFINYPYIMDDHILYIFFAGFVLCVSLSLVGVIKYYKHISKKRDEELLQMNEDDSRNDDHRGSMGGAIIGSLLKIKNGRTSNYTGATEGGSGKHRSRKITPANAINSQNYGRPNGRGIRGSIFLSSSGESGRSSASFKRSSYDVRIQRIESLHTTAEIVLTALTVSSIILAVYPQMPYGGVSPWVLRMLIWADFFCFSLFVLDLCGRYATRNIKEMPNMRHFMRENWYDVLALVITDIPLTFITFPELLGVLKAFRIVRVYRRFTQQAVFVSLMVKKPMLYLSAFVTIIIITSAVFIKIMEQEDDPAFRDFMTVLWFALVTVTTVGYGDYNVKKPGTWGLVFFLMLLGIGLISTLSAFCAELILSVGKSEETKREMRSELKNRAELLRVGLMHISEPYNPLAVALEDMMTKKNGPTGRRKSSLPLDLSEDMLGKAEAKHAMEQMQWIERNYETVNKHRSSVLNVTVGMKSDVTLPIERIMEGAGGKFRVGTITSQADLIRAVAKEYDRSVLLQVLRLRGLDGRIGGDATASRRNSADIVFDKFSSLDFSPKTRLNFLLLRFALHKPEKGGVINFTEMADELAGILFEPKRPLSCYLEIAFAVQREWAALKADEELENKPPFFIFDLRDPLHDKLVRIDEHLDRYGISRRVDFNEIMNELTTLLILHERVTTVQWALECLEYKRSRAPPKPVFEELDPPLAEMPAMDVSIINASSPSEEVTDEEAPDVSARHKRGKRTTTIARTKSKYF